MLNAQSQGAVGWCSTGSFLGKKPRKLKTQSQPPSQEHGGQIPSKKFREKFPNPFAFVAVSPPGQSWCFTALPGPQTPQPGQLLPHPSGISILLAWHTHHTIPEAFSHPKEGEGNQTHPSSFFSPYKFQISLQRKLQLFSWSRPVWIRNHTIRSEIVIIQLSSC